MSWKSLLVAITASALLLVTSGCTTPTGSTPTAAIPDRLASSVPVREGEDATAGTRDGALVVTIAGDSLTGAGELTLTPTELDGLAGWSIELTGGAELTGPARLTFMSPTTPSADVPPPLVMYAADTGELTPVDGVVMDGSVATVTTTHFSHWFVTWWDQALAGVLNWARGALDTIYAADAAGRHPRCTGEDAVRAGGYTVTSDSGSRVMWCLGQAGDGHELVVANARGYTVAAEHTPGLSVARSAPDDIASRVANVVREAPSKPGNTVTLVGPGDELAYSVAGTPTRSGVRVQPSVAGYLVTSTQFAIDTLVQITPYLGKGNIPRDRLLQLLAVESCFAGYSSMTTTTITTATDAGNYLNDALGTALGCAEGALSRAGLNLFQTALASGIAWVFAGVRTALNGFGAAADTALDPSGYQITVTAPAPPTAPPPATGPDAPTAAGLEGVWCTRSGQSPYGGAGDPCFSLDSLREQYPGMTGPRSIDSDQDAAGPSGFEICLEVEPGGGCTMAASIYLMYFPVGVGWHCPSQGAAWFDQPGCDPDWTSAHDTTQPRLRIVPNHQQNELFFDTEPLYRQ